MGPVRNHVDVAGDVFVGNTVEHVADGGGSFGDGHSGLSGDFFSEEIVGDVADVFGRGIVSY